MRSEADRREAAAKRAAKRTAAAKKPAAKKGAGRTASEAARARRATRKPAAKQAPAAPARTTAATAASAPARARLVKPRELWGRRSVAIGTVLVGLAIIGGLVLLIAGGGGDNGSDSSKQTRDLQEKLLHKTVVNPKDGISVRRPSAWSDSRVRGAILLRSKNRCLSMTLAAPAGASKANDLLRAAFDSFRQTQRNVAFQRAGHGEVGGIPTTSFQAAFKNSKGDQLRVLLSVGKGKKHAYLTQTVLGNVKCRSDLATAQVVLSSIQYTK